MAVPGRLVSGGIALNFPRFRNVSLPSFRLELDRELDVSADACAFLDPVPRDAVKGVK